MKINRRRLLIVGLAILILIVLSYWFNWIYPITALIIVFLGLFSPLIFNLDCPLVRLLREGKDTSLEKEVLYEITNN